MARYLIDVNLPYQENLTIVSKDTDFSDRALLVPPPPRVIHIRIGNMKMRAFHRTLSGLWAAACELSAQYRLVHVFEDRLEGID